MPSRNDNDAPTGPSLDGEGMSRFYTAAGVQTFHSGDHYWYEAGPRFLMGMPPHRTVVLDRASAREILRETGAAGIRYLTEPEGGGVLSYRTVARGADYGIERLSSNARSRVRRGLKRNEVRRILGSELADEGEQAFVETMRRQERFSSRAIESWRRLLSAVDSEPACEVWTAWHEGQLAAYLITIRIEDICEFFQARSRNDLLRSYPNNALIYHVAQHMLCERGVREISFGIETVSDDRGVEGFKASLGFGRHPVHQRVVFHPALAGVLAVPGVRTFIERSAEWGSVPEAWRKAAGLVRLAEPGGHES